MMRFQDQSEPMRRQQKDGKIPLQAWQETYLLYEKHLSFRFDTTKTKATDRRFFDWIFLGETQKSNQSSWDSKWGGSDLPSLLEKESKRQAGSCHSNPQEINMKELASTQTSKLPAFNVPRWTESPDATRKETRTVSRRTRPCMLGYRSSLGITPLLKRTLHNKPKWLRNKKAR